MSGWMCLSSWSTPCTDMLRFLCISEGLGQGAEGRGREDPMGAELRVSPEFGGSPKSFQLMTMEVESRGADCLSSPHPFFAWQIFRTQPLWPCKCRAVKDWGKERRELKVGGSSAAFGTSRRAWDPSLDVSFLLPA